MKISLCISLLIFPAFIFAQGNIEKKLDSLKTVKGSLQVQIRALQMELQSVNKKITDLEQQQSATPSNTITAKVTSGGAILRDAPSSMGNTVCNIPGGQTITVYREQSNLYFKVVYNGKTGYVNYSTIEQNNDIDDYLSGKTPVNNNNTSTTTIVRKVDETDPKYQKLLKLYGKETALKIMNNELWNGMSPGMVLESKGKPFSKQTNTDASGNIEVWSYSDVNVQFKNGEVINVTKK